MGGGGVADAEQSVAVAQCVADIESADFVALDLEFSGLFLNVERDRRILSLDQCYEKCADSIPHFLPLQLGVSCARKHQDSNTWELRSHEFNVWPQDRRVFTADLQSLRFLRSHGFDFNAFFQQAHLYVRLPPDDADKAALARLPAAHVTRVVAALRRTRVPLVFHNGLLDVLHLYDKFVGKLPDESGEFCEAWIGQFPLLFDTRLMAQEGRFQVLKHSGGLSLEELHRHLSGIASMPVKFERAGPLGAGRSAHGSSGYDAMITAEVFVMEMDLWLRADAPQGSKRRRKAVLKPSAVAEAAAAAATDATAAAAPAEDAEGWTVVGRKRPLEGQGAAGAAGEAAAAGLTSPSLLESHETCRRFHNRLAIMGAAPPVLDLGRPVGLQMGLPTPPAASGNAPAFPPEPPPAAASAPAFPPEPPPVLPEALLEGGDSDLSRAVVDV